MIGMANQPGNWINQMAFFYFSLTYINAKKLLVLHDHL